ncbi:RNA-binding (RRM/RBD/RNP motifs) family protein [Arabidopsis thaliana]|uniref:RNA-binding (RRM/RBD/RNP motifs) family protein n=1 Tax=Arabidopsis thaliana TaxID=3702 RepID=A0A1I9LLU4_ARATH|nr:RNA-binding (RRM/RBD/RNP motifs) family protein [Arabidopsis thaliana]ANM63552.1 RNA-binding (RRM/RBD/RNP motifs) family protein [Arabidopsis thaliana]|eukprot:NP_001325632.1 RNA-binding (RRM/RBD/RNP motifs) family protein [Arabidopsis thaliana]
MLIWVMHCSFFYFLICDNFLMCRDIGQKVVHWYSLGGLISNLKQKIMGNVILMDKSSGEDSVLPKSPMVSSSDVAVTKVVTLKNVAESENCIHSSVKEEIGSEDASQSVAADNKICITSSIKEESFVSEMGSQDASQSVAVENKNCISSSIKEESSVSEMGSQDASQSVAGIEACGKRESITVSNDRLGNINRLDGLESGQGKVLRSIRTERVDPSEEQSSKDVTLGFLTEEVSESQTSSRKNMGKLQPAKGLFDKVKPPQNSLSKLFVNSDPYKEVKHPLRFETLSNSNSSMSTGESCSDAGDQHSLFGKMLSDPVQEIKSIPNENDEHRLSDAPQNLSSLTSVLLRDWIDEQRSEDLAAIRERKSIFSLESSRNTVAPMAVGTMKKLMDSLNFPTDNGTDAEANSLNSNSREEKWISEGNSAMQNSDRFCAIEEEEPQGETFVMETQSLCSQDTLDATTVNPKFGAVLHVQEIPSIEGCIYKDALLTFETNTAVKKALKKGHVTVMNYNTVVEATSQEDMVERICIPDLIGDPDVPVALVKEPARTVKIHPLTHDFSSNQIKEALKFCRSNISKFTLGSSRTDAFVEFETEDGKERALAEHSISICNTQLFISRIDIPRTIVARISNLSKSAMRDVRALCVPYGQIRGVYIRGTGVADVFFDISEWPNMLAILNSMNGMEIDGKKLVVRPATTVIPPEILRVLWKDPREKRYVKSVIQNLVREIEQPLDATRCHTLITELLL